MILHIAEYRFKDAATKAQAIAYLSEVYLPAKKLQPGFLSGLIAENGPLGISAMLRFETKEQIQAAAAERLAFKAFITLLAEKPSIVIAPDLAAPEFSCLSV